MAGAVLKGACLSGADLRRATFNSESVLDGIVLANDEYGSAQLAGVNWSAIDLTLVDWSGLTAQGLGDEPQVKWRQYRSLVETPAALSVLRDFNVRLRAMLPASRRREEYEDAVRANRQLAIALRAQDLSEHAGRFAYRAQVLQRDLDWQQRHWGRWLFTTMLWAVSGFGYRLWRILAAYGAVLLVFTVLYWRMGVHSFPHEPGLRAFWDSFLISLSAIHGRTTFEQLGAWSFAAWIAAVESVVGIVIEGVFVAMLVQRFFAR